MNGAKGYEREVVIEVGLREWTMRRERVEIRKRKIAEKIEKGTYHRTRIWQLRRQRRRWCLHSPTVV